jgi:1-acyl-sn-glycerol-3-phosphate acyltransferase
LISVLFIDFEKPQEKDNPFYRLQVKLLVPAVLTVVGARIHAKGFKQAPKDGRFLLVCNHLHELDPIVLMKYFPNAQLAFVSKQETKKLFVVGPLMHKIMCQFVNRENDREALKTIINCIRLIKEDRASIGVFPEGYIKPDRKLHHFRSGVFKIATKTNVPIVVCTITNTNHMIRNFKKLKPTHIDLHLVKVIQPEEYEGMTTVELGEQIYQMMAQDLGPDRVSQEEEENS